MRIILILLTMTILATSLGGCIVRAGHPDHGGHDDHWHDDYHHP